MIAIRVGYFPIYATIGTNRSYLSIFTALVKRHSSGKRIRNWPRVSVANRYIEIYSIITF